MKTFPIFVLMVFNVLNAANAYNPSDVKQVKAGRDCQQCDLRGADLEGADLRGLNLANAWMTKANLKGANLEKTKIDYATLNAANLEGANLKNASAYDTKFLGANLKNVSFDGADLAKADFGPGKWGGQQYPQADLAGASFQGAKLRGAKGLPPAVVNQKTKKKQSRKNGRKSSTGKPDRDFLDSEMHVIAGGSPMAGGFSVNQIVDAWGMAKKTWEASGAGKWMLTVNKTDQMSGKRLTTKMLFTPLRPSEGDGVLLKRVIMNGHEMNQGQIFQLAQQLALKAEAKQ